MEQVGFESGTVRLAGKRQHDPTDADTDDEKEKERPEDVFDAVCGTAAAEKPESDGDDRGEEEEGLEVGHERAIGSGFPSARGFIGVEGGEEI